MMRTWRTRWLLVGLSPLKRILHVTMPVVLPAWLEDFDGHPEWSGCKL